MLESGLSMQREAKLRSLAWLKLVNNIPLRGLEKQALAPENTSLTLLSRYGERKLGSDVSRV